MKEFKFLGEVSFIMTIVLAILGFRTTLSVNISFIKHDLRLFKPHWRPNLILFQPFYLLRSACHNEQWVAACWTSKVWLGNWRAAPWSAQNPCELSGSRISPDWQQERSSREVIRFGEHWTWCFPYGDYKNVCLLPVALCVLW